MTEPEQLQQVNRTCVRYRGRTLAYFSGCDYFRLASHPKVIAALQTGVRKYGLNVAASRLTTGNHRIYGELERRLAGFFGAESATLVSTGYLANIVAAQALAGNFSHVLIDEKAHPSLCDASRFLDCPVLQFPHRDPSEVGRAVKRCGPGSRLILLTDGMFSHDGSAAPLAEYLKVLPSDALMLVDDAHAAGVLGETGKGSIEHAGVGGRRIIQAVTLSKAFGTYGGAIIGTAALRRRILDRSRSFVGSTPLPLPLANAALQSIKILKTDKTLRRRLERNANFVKNSLRKAGLELPDAPSPIVPLLPKTEAQASRLRRSLLAAGVFPPFIKYPGGPANGYFRFVISSEHSRDQLDRLAGVLTSQ
jgi:glycine C-acetyltransferase/8-amino-7-oxononanoate synthase